MTPVFVVKGTDKRPRAGRSAYIPGFKSIPTNPTDPYTLVQPFCPLSLGE